MLNEEKKQFEKEQDQLLNTVLEYRYFKPWRQGGLENTDLYQDANLEIYLTNTCNQRCEYCYLVKYGEELYPKEAQNPQTILANLRIFYEYVIEQDFKIPFVEILSGEVWHTKFGWDFLDLTLEYLKKGMKFGRVLIPSNVSFVLKDEPLHRIQGYIDAYNDIGCPLLFSISVDGLLIDEQERPMVNGYVRSQEDYDKIFAFARHNHFMFHPMVSSSSAPHWIENHKWWEAQMNKWGMDVDKMMMLEVRDPDWTAESMAAYNQFLDYLIQRDLEQTHHGNIEEFARKIFAYRLNSDIPMNIRGYVPYVFTEGNTFIGCTIANEFCLRPGDLAIVPCHRTSYNKYTYGYFIVEDGKITGLRANNPTMAVKVIMANYNNSLNKCDTCLWKDYCLRGCYGVQYEAQGDPFFPVENVCNFFESKYNFLLSKYKELGILDYLKQVSPLERDYPTIKKFLDLVKRWEHTNVG